VEDAARSVASGDAELLEVDDVPGSRRGFGRWRCHQLLECGPEILVTVDDAGTPVDGYVTGRWMY
jgi:hypothetical protein